MRWAGHVARMGRRRCAYKLLVVRCEERDHSENVVIDGGGMHWIDLAQNTERWGALVNTVMNLRFP